MNVADEAGWLAEARLGDPAALARLYDLYARPMYTLCHRVLANEDDAQDAMQAAFVKAFRNIGAFRGDCAFKTWLYRIAVNEAVALLRKRRRAPLPLADGVPCAGGVRGVAERVSIEAALRRVKPDHRVILILRFWEDLSYEEIAGVLGVSLPAVKMRLARARQEFRRCYDDD